MTLAAAKNEFQRMHPNLPVNGWDERDSRFWGQLMGLPSYGLIANDQNNPMISRKEVMAIIAANAETRFREDWSTRRKLNEGTGKL